jgi:hypothetical protein
MQIVASGAAAWVRVLSFDGEAVYILAREEEERSFEWPAVAEADRVPHALRSTGEKRTVPTDTKSGLS